jgi:23S rRNA (adenine2503-C2)-methyltransferase
MLFVQLEKALEGEPNYRLRQAKKAIFIDLIDDWSKAMTLPLSLRRKLNEKLSLQFENEILISKDQRTVKILITLEDGLKIESVLMRHRDRNTVCVSSQVGCPLGCVFCATGRMGFKRNLEVFEIIEQVLLFARYLKKSGEKITNLVFMGMGEPFLNYENVLAAIKILNDKEGFNLGARKISISTVGIVEGIGKLAEEKLQVNLAISLHAPTDKLRSKIMPINKKYSLKKNFRAVDDYIGKTNRKVMFEYLMIKNLNDSDECARELAKLMKKPLYFINLISYNPVGNILTEVHYNPTGNFQPSPKEIIRNFKNILEKGGVSVTERYRFGRDIKAACGQLATEK